MDTYAIWKDLDRLAEFTVTDDHLALLRRAYVRWSEVEFGAPEIDGKRPYGSSNVLADVAEAVEPGFGVDYLVDWSVWLDRNEERLTRLHVETALALQIALTTSEFRTGTYRKASRYAARSWYRVDAEAVAG